MRAGVPALTAVLTAAGIALSGCALGTDRTQEDWALDADSGLYYRQDLLAQSDDPIREHLPRLTAYTTVTWADGRFTDPERPSLLPAPDESWWQAVVRLEPEEAARLAGGAGGASDGDGASDAGGGAGAGSAPRVPEDEVRAQIVPTLEQSLESCGEDWRDVTAALAQEGTSDVTAAGDLLGLAALCPGTGQLAIWASDM